MKKASLLIALFLGSYATYSQAYQFENLKEIKCTPVISQDKTGTCWSFSSTSFLEAEIIRTSGKAIDLSEMYNVRHTYPKKAWNFVMRQGKAQFGEGGLNHDVINSARDFGIVPVTAYSGLANNAKEHDHSKMAEELEKYLKTQADPSKKPDPNWKDEVSKILDTYMEKDVTEFIYEGKSYTPKSFLAMTKLNMEDYVTISSFSHEPFYRPFILDIPDNFSNGSFYNLPLEEFVQNVDNALEKGYTLALDADVSERTFSGKNGVAVIPNDPADQKSILTGIRPEKSVTQVLRQAEFENFNTTDDHLMHIVGKAKDQKGNIYYKVKNSWGSNPERVANGGFVYMSVPYLKLKAISVLLHKDGLVKSTKKQLGIK
jgi:bleomycin hydrolase